jgi:hypothetical protein
MCAMLRNMCFARGADNHASKEMKIYQPEETKMKKTIKQADQSQSTTAKEREKPSWTVDLGSFFVNAESEEEAIQEAEKMIAAGDVEIDQVFENEEDWIVPLPNRVS